MVSPIAAVSSPQMIPRTWTALQDERRCGTNQFRTTEMTGIPTCGGMTNEL